MGRRRKEDISVTGETPTEETVEVVETSPMVEEPVDITQELVTIFKKYSKTLVPTLVEYRPQGSVGSKYVIVEMDNGGLNEAWTKYKELLPNGNSEDFLVKVYSITHQDIPRMYRAVTTISLK